MVLSFRLCVLAPHPSSPLPPLAQHRDSLSITSVSVSSEVEALRVGPEPIINRADGPALQAHCSRLAGAMQRFLQYSLVNKCALIVSELRGTRGAWASDDFPER